MRRSFSIWCFFLTVLGCSEEESEPEHVPTEVGQVQQALSTVLYATEDDFENNASRWAGTAIRGWVGKAGQCLETTGDRDRYMNVKWNLSQADLACSEITSVYFTFTQEGCNTCSGSQTMNLYRHTATWSETADTGSCASTGASPDFDVTGTPDFQSTSTATSISGPSYNSTSGVWNTSSFNVYSTNQADELISDLEAITRGTFPNYGYQLRASGTTTSADCRNCTTTGTGSGVECTCGTSFCFANTNRCGAFDGSKPGCGGNKKSIRTSEHSTTSHRPRLTIYYNRSNALCDDGNPCTTDTCTTSGCSHANVTNGTACNDGFFCNGTETCTNGVCGGSSGDPCPNEDGDGDCSERCNESTDSCTANDVNGSACTNGSFCDGTETCSSGVCTNSTGNPCPGPDGDGDCTESCNETNDNCTANDVSGSACTNGSYCDGTETCSSGVCTNSTGDPCPGPDGDSNCSESCSESTDSCTASDGNGAPCDDGTFCNGADFCSNGVCSVNAGNPCPGPDGDGDCSETCDETADGCTANDTNGSACDNGSFCDGTETCSSGACTNSSGDPCPGPDDDGNCAESCNETNDDCTANDTNGSACNDGLFCTATDQCASGSCAGSGDPCPGPDGDGDCSETCDETNDNCTANDANGSACDDALFCTATDECTSGSCVGSGDPCPGPDGDDDCSETCDETADGCTANDTNGSACNNGSFCDGTETCSSGVCDNSTGDPCPGPDGDGNCAESCDETGDNCAAADVNGSACDDGLFCTAMDECASGSCVGSGDPCPGPDGDIDCAESCDETGDNCLGNDGDTSLCDDGDACTTADACAAGACVGGSAPNCDDGNECTADSCDLVDGCVNTPLSDGTACSVDGNVCTYDTCQSGLCNQPVPAGSVVCRTAVCDDTATPPYQIAEETCDGTAVCPGPNVTDCGTLSEPEPCNASQTACQGACGLDGDCPSGFYCQASTSSCEPVIGPGGGCTRTGQCDSIQSLTCVDGVCCTTACDGVCEECSSSGNGTCSPETGTGCSDGDACTTGDTCNAGACEGGAPPDCDDANVCTADSCDSGSGCVNAPVLDGSTCDDGDACTVTDTCQAGACTGTGALGCDDGNVCTDDSCDPASGCVHSNNTASCEDGDACTENDTCSGGACQPGSTVTCDDTNICTDDSCDPASGCVFSPNTVSCDDGNACTTNDTCSAGGCAGGAPLDCNDGNDCTSDSCNTSTGCVNSALTGSGCEDGDACTENDICNAGACESGSAVVCNDGNDCTADSCDPATGCTAAPVTDGSACEDGDACTQSDTCTSGICQSGSAVVCDDGDDCTTDGCDPATGCIATTAPDGTSCDNGDACTLNDTCASGLCQAGSAVDCDDGKPCTVDSCNPSSGCVNTAGNIGTICRAAAGFCDDAEICEGAADCPTDGYDTTEKVCRSASCTDGVATAQASCDGSGASCPAVVTTDCGLYACDGTACGTTCGDDSNCAATAWCDSGSCAPKATLGVACTEGRQCQSGSCVDGVCCDTDCTGQCEACNLSGSLGACSFVTGDPVAPRALCAGDGSACHGTCGGASASCVFPDSSVECRAQSCSNGIAIVQASCEGTGSCPPLQTVDCSPNTCDMTGSVCRTGCLGDADCTTGFFCQAGACVTKAGNGTACTAASECLSDHCVDGFCCDSDCEGQCEACGETGSEGACIPVVGDPRGSRSACAGEGTVCAGSCDGFDAVRCNYPGSGVECRGAACVSGVATLRAFCNGAGTCPDPVEVSCPSGGCSGSLCADDLCDIDDECNSGEFCAAGVCVLLAPVGTPCGSAAECSSGNCVDGVCCSTACLGQCEACDVEGSIGTCTPVSGDPHGARQPCNSDGSVCGGTCDGITAVECSFPTTATPCRSASCLSGVAVLGAVCQGDGTCAPYEQQDCGAFGCVAGGTLCDGGCTTDVDCTSGSFCSGGVCVSTRTNGQACSADSHCASGFCTDGVCCESACDGICEACDEQATEGTCAPVVGLPHGGRPACPGTGVCGGRCDGTNRVQCTFPGAFIPCGTAVCADGVRLTEPLCNSAGSCRPPAQVDCEPYFCADSVDCATFCATDADCRAGYSCENGGCAPLIVVPPMDAGSTDGGFDAGSGFDASFGGTAGAGATAGSGGASGGAAGGAGALGGSAGSAGSGAATVDAGVPVDAGFTLDESKDDPGCGCRVPATTSHEGAGGRFIAALMLAAGLAWRRRRCDRGTRSGV